MAQLELHNIAKSYGTNHVLDAISLTVGDGEFVSVLGPSGSGKSTIFQLIGGLYPPDSGTISLDGTVVNGSRGHISYMPQSPALFPWRTVLQNVQLSAEIAGTAQDTEKTLGLIQSAGLAGYEHAYPGELSGGMKQRVSFIRSLNAPQPIICLDEPFSALDEFTRLEMQQWLLSIWEANRKSILFITHDIDEALFLSDRILVLSNKPAVVKRDLTVPFARPRSEELLLSEEFLQLKRDIYDDLRKEIHSSN
ncbi:MULTISPECIES: ABC transporter ATP-binding protein [Sporosarcina]|uniref:ABC transporter ATP-binding protein n=1 Tax=Sporosarcina TaxID=1569 RepID=UPI00058D0320|nr:MULTISPECIES: ABC transporter ATP-binding protein [Sporosarcina]WJY27625.1 ABC transporter ATP-binding protein [Sporosarcina sp. 0.2-SM1T-5]